MLKHSIFESIISEGYKTLELGNSSNKSFFPNHIKFTEIALALGAANVTTLEYRPIECDHDQVYPFSI